MALVKVSGIGAVCHAGESVPGLWEGMTAAVVSPRDVRDPFLDAPVRLVYQVAGAEHERDGTAGHAPAGSRAGRLAMTAVDEALADAGGGPDPMRTGVVVGSCMGASGENEARRERGREPALPLYGLASEVAARLGASGPALNIANACAAGAYALGHAADLIRSGECDRVVVVGVEAYSRVALACFNQMAALDPRGCRPFASDRGGTAFGEGAGALVLDVVSAGQPARDGRADEVHLAGAGFSCDAGHATAPAADGLQARRALAAALAQAGITEDDVDLVVPHGTGTVLNDQVEADVFDELWPGRSAPPAVYNAKALLGHTGGGAGALGAVVAVMCLRQAQVPANCDVGALMPSMARFLEQGPRAVGDTAVVNAYAFGGNNATLVLRRAS